MRPDGLITKLLKCNDSCNICTWMYTSIGVQDLYARPLVLIIHRCIHNRTLGVNDTHSQQNMLRVRTQNLPGHCKNTFQCPFGYLLYLGKFKQSLCRIQTSATYSTHDCSNKLAFVETASLMIQPNHNSSPIRCHKLTRDRMNPVWIVTLPSILYRAQRDNWMISA
jgi:hypothetical protein